MDDLLIIANYIKKRLRRAKPRITIVRELWTPLSNFIRIEFTRRSLEIIMTDSKVCVRMDAEAALPSHWHTKHSTTFELASPNSIEDIIKCAKRHLGIKK